jgi:hypothetical protein
MAETNLAASGEQEPTDNGRGADDVAGGDGVAKDEIG